MKRIKTIVEKVLFYYGKKETGYHSPDDIVRELNVESINVFQDLLDKYAITRKISEFLQPFMKSQEVDINNSGIGSKPSEFAHAIDVRGKAELLETGMWNERLNHPNKPPTSEFPIVRMHGNNIEVRPVDVETIHLDYFKLPTEAKYSYQISGDDYVYEDSTSVDWEWSKTMEDRIINRTLANLGITIKDRDVVQYSQAERMQE